MPAGQLCKHCRQAGHNRTTCPVRKDEEELQRLAEIRSRERGRWERIVVRLRNVIKRQRLELAAAGAEKKLLEVNLEAAGLTIDSLRVELDDREAKVARLESLLAALAIHSDPLD